MRHLEGRKVRWASGDEGEGRQHQPSTEEGRRRREQEERGERKHKPGRSCTEIDGHSGMLEKLNCTKRPTKHHKHCP